jgi:hypothetical protein
MTLNDEIKAFTASKDKTPLRKVTAKLDAFEREALGDLFANDIIRLRYKAKLQFMAGDITQSKYAWGVARAKWLEQIGIKLGVLSADTGFKP